MKRITGINTLLKSDYLFEPGPKPEVEPEPSTPEIEPTIPPDSPLPNITF